MCNLLVGRFSFVKSFCNQSNVEKNKYKRDSVKQSEENARTKKTIVKESNIKEKKNECVQRECETR